ncbi:acyl carrier protein [Actinoplanes regularis]|uniref:Phosphopantetheine attachment site n=1 Tax=Actinoplanes regularis TaxID=52697 RepID=A0A239HAY7_9ACTN|nr:acyl carrier protein [Actinoplanes regularis]GIE90976.1 hypothetical protein Are01nite_74560 [Actinoplanes regularis]SNS78606.1 hypothetical protein SAMN06264365_12415 [Actinoplanes regularis]
MIAEPPVPTRSRDWTPVLAGLHADLMDCIQVNLAAFADRAHGAGTHLALGALLRFDTVPGPGGVPIVGATVEQRLAEAADLLAVRVDQRFDDVTGARLREISAGSAPLFVVADAYTMSWVPYAGHQHMEHSFLLLAADGPVLVGDGYHNATPWGDIRPGVWRLPAAGFDDAVPRATAMTLTAAAPPVLDRAAVLTENAVAMSAATGRIDRYLAALHEHREEPETAARLVLDVWLLGRSRALHAAWLGTYPEVDAAGQASAQAESWSALAAQSYVAMRRASRGGAFPTAVLDRLGELLHEDVALARRLAGGDPATGTPAGAGSTGDPDGTRAVLAEELAAVLGLGAGLLDGRPSLRSLPGFNSFRLVEVIERVEARLRVTLDPDELTGAALHDLDTLTVLFDRARSAVAQP